ncbi:MAG TPA: helix-turn-helix domain-containing protein [Polyangiaceae bacterium]|nr:helix-turn-helix domain-containing protein [Polyangiaceae bacterium]
MNRHSQQLCPRFQTAINLIGKRWTGMLLNVLLRGPARFGELLERLEVVGDRMLSERLKELEAEGIVERRVVPSHPVRVEYELTDKGRALAPVVDAVAKWAEAWIVLDPKVAQAPKAAESDCDEAKPHAAARVKRA